MNISTSLARNARTKDAPAIKYGGNLVDILHFVLKNASKTAIKLQIMMQERMDYMVLAKGYLIIVLDTMSSEYLLFISL